MVYRLVSGWNEQKWTLKRFDSFLFLFILKETAMNYSLLMTTYLFYETHVVVVCYLGLKVLSDRMWSFCKLPLNLWDYFFRVVLICFYFYSNSLFDQFRRRENARNSAQTAPRAPCCTYYPHVLHRIRFDVSFSETGDFCFFDANSAKLN